MLLLFCQSSENMQPVVNVYPTYSRYILQQNLVSIISFFFSFFLLILLLIRGWSLAICIAWLVFYGVYLYVCMVGIGWYYCCYYIHDCSLFVLSGYFSFVRVSVLRMVLCRRWRCGHGRIWFIFISACLVLLGFVSWYKNHFSLIWCTGVCMHVLGDWFLTLPHVSRQVSK